MGTCLTSGWAANNSRPKGYERKKKDKKKKKEERAANWFSLSMKEYFQYNISMGNTGFLYSKTNIYIYIYIFLFSIKKRSIYQLFHLYAGFLEKF